jgi:5-methylcytosine-specific restriction endonuclease McrA
MKRRLTRLRHRYQCRNSGQCSVCGGVFPDWNGGICTGCQATGRT